MPSIIPILPQSIHFRRIVYILPNSKGFARLYILSGKTLIFKLSGITPSPLPGKLFHFTFHRNTTPFPSNNPTNARRINLSAREAQPFQHAPQIKTYPHKIAETWAIFIQYLYCSCIPFPTKYKFHEFCTTLMQNFN